MHERARLAGHAWGVVALAIGCTLGAYVVVRAWALSFTHDESITYNRYAHAPFFSMLLSHGTDANNHPLNTLAMQFANATFGSSEISLRWSSVAAFVVYIIALGAVLRRVSRVWVRLLGLSVAVANPYVLDFFSLARGYALALALVAASAMFALRCVELPTVRMAFAAVTCAAVAVIANFATLDYYLGVLVVIGLVLVQGRRACEVRVDLHRLAAAIIAPTLAVAYLGGVPLIRLRSEGELYYGGETGFWHDTVRSLISSSLYHRGGDLFHLALAVSVGMSVAIGGVAAVLAMRRRHLPPHAAAFVLLAVPGFATVAQHALLGSRFLIDRTALFFVPLFAIWLALAADALARDPRYRAGVTAGAAVIAIAAWVNLASAANLSSTLDWRYDASTKQVVGDLSARLGTGRPIDLGASWLFEPTINFYRATRYPSFVPVPTCRSACLAARSDYYYVVGPDVATVRARGAQVIRIYQPAGGVLARDADAHT